MKASLLQTRIRLGHYRNLLFDWCYHVDTCGQQSVSQLGITGRRAAQAHGFSSSSISTVQAILAHLPIRHDEWVFVDLGAGKGRTLLLAAAYPFKYIVGVEHAPFLAALAQANLRNYTGRLHCPDTRVVVGDALDYRPTQDDNLLVYMFNPFSMQLVARCVETLAATPCGTGKRRMLCFVQQRTALAPMIDLGRLCTALAPIALRPLPFDWLSHPQLEVSLYDVFATS